MMSLPKILEQNLYLDWVVLKEDVLPPDTAEAIVIGLVGACKIGTMLQLGMIFLSYFTSKLTSTVKHWLQCKLHHAQWTMTKTDYQETTEYKKSPRKVVIHAFVLSSAMFFFSLFRPWLVPGVANSCQKFPARVREEKFCRRKKVRLLRKFNFYELVLA